MRRALLVAKACLEAEIATMGELLEIGTNDWYIACERMFHALDAVADALGEPRAAR